MPPRLSGDDRTHGTSAYAKLCGDSALHHTSSNTLSNFPNVGLRQFGVGERAPLRMAAPALLLSVADVVAQTPFEQMATSRQRNPADLVDSLIIVPDTGAVVAGVADSIGRRKRLAGCQFPRKTVGIQLVSALLSYATIAAGEKVYVSDPAPFSLLDADLETSGVCRDGPRCIAPPAAEVASFCQTGLDKRHRTARATGALDVRHRSGARRAAKPGATRVHVSPTGEDRRTTPLTGDHATLTTHRKASLSGAVLPAVTSSAGALSCLNYTW